jgi:hypothetical protein
MSTMPSDAFPPFHPTHTPHTPTHPHTLLDADFMVEVANSSRLRSLLTPERRVTLPALHTALCSSKVLTMEWVAGTKVSRWVTPGYTNRYRACVVQGAAPGAEDTCCCLVLACIHTH